MNELDREEYYVRRADESRRMARQATSPKIAAIHAKFAENYELSAQEAARLDASDQV